MVVNNYDDFNRLTKIIDGDNHLNYSYQKDESDIRIQQDERSFISRLSKGRTMHNSLNINHLYTRTVGTPHKLVYLDPHQNRFKLPSFEQIIATDINHDASQRRRLYNATEKQKSKQRDFDKPSNSIFIPPIYTAIHCELDFCWELLEVFLTGPTTAIVGQPTTFTATAVVSDLDLLNQCTLQHRFSVDGNIIEYNGSGLFNYTFQSPGSKNIEVRSNCQNCATWNFQYDTVQVSSLPSYKECPATADGIAKATLTNLPIAAFEYGLTFVCVNLPNSDDVIEAQHLVDSFSEGQANDPCRVRPWNDRSDGVRGIAHTHPYFIEPEQLNVGVGCGGIQSNLSYIEIAAFNEDNQSFSEADITAHIVTMADDYLGVPDRSKVKVLRESEYVEETLP